MSKNINIDAHLKRYATTELSDIVRLIDGLKNLVDHRREATITQKKQELALLESGGVPEKPIVEKATRGGRKNKTEQEAEG